MGTGNRNTVESPQRPGNLWLSMLRGKLKELHFKQENNNRSMRSRESVFILTATLGSGKNSYTKDSRSAEALSTCLGEK